jgi:hypothetical protein
MVLTLYARSLVAVPDAGLIENGQWHIKAFISLLLK